MFICPKIKHANSNMAIKCKCCAGKIDRYNDYIDCTGKCASSFHIECVDISLEQLSKMRERGADGEWICCSCTVQLTSKVVTLEGTEEPRNREDSIVALLELKLDGFMNALTDNVINPLREEIEKLNIENRLLSQEVKSLSTAIAGNLNKFNIRQTDGAACTKNSQTEKEKEKPTKHSQVKKQNKNSESDDMEITNNGEKTITSFATMLKKTVDNDVDVDRIELQISSQPTSGGNLTKENIDYPTQIDTGTGHKVDADGFRRVYHRRKRVVVGTAAGSTLRASTTYGYLHVYNLQPGTNVDDVVSHLRLQNITNVQCEGMESKYPERYASFKLTVPLEQLEEIKNPALWPRGSKINRFLLYVGKRTPKT